MENEASSFETSEVLATFLASTPLLSDTWRLCNLANTTPNPPGFVTQLIGSTGYVAFSSMKMISESDICYGNLVRLDSGNNQLFSVLHRQINEGEEPIMVYAAFLHLFFTIYGSPVFQTQMEELMKKSKSIVITGHSMGGTTASLATLWLLSYLQSKSSPLSVLCITFGSPLLGNESLSRAILRERWDGNFCHVVAKYDIMPPLSQLSTQLLCLLKYWPLSLTSPEFRKLALQSHNDTKAHIDRFFLTSFEELMKGGEGMATSSRLWPFGSYFFCSEDGAICLDNASSVIEMMYLMLRMGLPSCSVEDHLRYGDYVRRISLQFLNQRSFMPGDLPPRSCYEAGIALALQSSGIASQEPVAELAKNCLKMARRMGRTPNLHLANLAIKLSKITPYRAEIEWYKACCDDSDDQMGYYDSFKLRGTSKRDAKVNMNRIKLGKFWDSVINMLENNNLPHDFHRRGKWVNASQFYKLLVEPLDIAEYYRSGMRGIRGHYMQHGRERRYKIFDRWWKERRVTEEENSSRSTLASSTQDSCFWARVEEAKECLANVRSESDRGRLDLLWRDIEDFERYATELVESKRVSKDVLATNSSYVRWVEELKELRSQLLQLPVRLPTIVDTEIVP